MGDVLTIEVASPDPEFCGAMTALKAARRMVRDAIRATEERGIDPRKALGMLEKVLGRTEDEIIDLELARCAKALKVHE